MLMGYGTILFKLGKRQKIKNLGVIIITISMILLIIGIGIWVNYTENLVILTYSLGALL